VLLPNFMRTGSALLLGLLATACGLDPISPSAASGGGLAGTAGAPSSATGANGGTNGEAASVSADGCSAAAKDIYVVSNDFVLHRFDPSKLSFDRVGPFDCIGPSSPDTVSDAKYLFRGMAVDRSGHGWMTMVRIRQSIGSAIFQSSDPQVEQALVEFDTSHATCKVHDFSTVMTFAEYSECGFFTFTNPAPMTTKCEQINERVVGNLAYSAAAGMADVLYGTEDASLISFDPAAQQKKPIGILTAAKMRFSAGLAGTGDGRLFELSSTAGQNDDDVEFGVVQRDRATAAAIDISTIDFDSVHLTPSAMTFWGGDLLFFGTTKNGGSSEASVVRYETASKKLTTLIDSIQNVAPHANDFSAVLGAANSTCAPLVR
jgi:hypothetical protein